MRSLNRGGLLIEMVAWADLTVCTYVYTSNKSHMRRVPCLGN